MYNQYTVKCPKCKGSGRVYDHLAGILSLGAVYLFQAVDDELKEMCPRCNGRGFIKPWYNKRDCTITV